MAFNYFAVLFRLLETLVKHKAHSFFIVDLLNCNERLFMKGGYL